MLDTKAVEKLVKEQIAIMVADEVGRIFADQDWLEPVKQQIITLTKNQILSRFVDESGSAGVEIIDAVKKTTIELFDRGRVPGVEKFIDQSVIKQAVDESVRRAVINVLDAKSVQAQTAQQVIKMVTDEVNRVFATENWLEPVHQQLISYTQDRVLARFANSSMLPEVIESVKKSLIELFESGAIPGLENYVDTALISRTVNSSVQTVVTDLVLNLEKDPVWLEKIERTIEKSAVERTAAGLNAIDVVRLVRNRVDELVDGTRQKIIDNLAVRGIQAMSPQVELTVLDNTVVIENNLVTKNIEAVETATVNNLTVTGSINIDSPSWNQLRDNVSDVTLNKITSQWKQALVTEIVDSIKHDGINLADVRIAGQSLISNGALSNSITDSNLQSVGQLRTLTVAGKTNLAETLSAVNKRVGINTQDPEMALSIWDEEVNILAGKVKNKTAYIGTGRAQGLAIGINRDSAIDIDIDGLTTVKKLRVGVHRVSFSNELPGYSGTKGDIVFNADPTINSNVFAWQCLGGHKWKVIRTVE